ncbi:MAG TPA: DNA-formamidopyrimidine glycosylase family protein [Candidatus Paceibacterota bacterium]|nr:DNA-formamidopyrimidine glycosylase family protein [Candidatus Paceibacterota bacterium]
MPELPEIEVLVRCLRPLLRGKTIRGVDVRRAKVLSPTSPQNFQRALMGARFHGLFRARLSPRLAANRLNLAQARRLWLAIREVLAEAIECGSTLPLNQGAGNSDGRFYFGRAPNAPDFYEERLRVYDRAGEPCWNCLRPIKRIVQAARSTCYCSHCQKTRE